MYLTVKFLALRNSILYYKKLIKQIWNLRRCKMKCRPLMLVADVDICSARLEQPRQRLGVVRVGSHADLALHDTCFQVRPLENGKSCINLRKEIL